MARTPMPTTDKERMLIRVRALLAKAESTAYQDEAAALTAKAHELMAAHAIDLALIEEQTGRGEIEVRHLHIEAPYPKEKATLLSGVAWANRCRVIIGLDSDTVKRLAGEDPSQLKRGGRHTTMIGYGTDLDIVELLYTSLHLQAVNLMLNHGSVTNPWGENRTKSFRRSFLAAFASTIAERLEENRLVATETADEATGGSVLPVLVDRSDRVDERVGELFPQLGTLRLSVSNSAGVRAGHDAGAQADIGTSRLKGRQRAIER